MRIKFYTCLASLMFSGTFSPTAGAQAVATTAPCELHVWPAERMGSNTTGLLGVGLLNEVLHSGRNASNKAQLSSALDSASQMQTLDTLDMVFMLELKPGTIVVRHQDPLERRTINAIKTRRSASTANCYLELITADVVYHKVILGGQGLTTLWMIRDFGNDQQIDFQHKAWSKSVLFQSLPKEGEDIDTNGVIYELLEAFKSNFQQYAGSARKSMRGKKRI